MEQSRFPAGCVHRPGTPRPRPACPPSRAQPSPRITDLPASALRKLPAVVLITNASLVGGILMAVRRRRTISPYPCAPHDRSCSIWTRISVGRRNDVLAAGVGFDDGWSLSSAHVTMRGTADVERKRQG